MERENELVLLRNYGNPLIAQFHKALLEENGIPCMIKDLGFNFPCAFFSDSNAGVKLLVMNKDLQNALNLFSDDDEEDDSGLDTDEDDDLDLDEDLDIDIDFDDDEFDNDEDDVDTGYDDDDIKEGFDIGEDFDKDDLFDDEETQDDFGFEEEDED